MKGTASQSNGDFSAEDLPMGSPLRLSVSAIGYTALQQVVVTASRPSMTLDMEKKVFNVSKDIVSAGGNGLDLLKNVPGVNVDIDANITMRGASPQIMVDGKPTTLTLDEIPSDAIFVPSSVPLYDRRLKSSIGWIHFLK